MFKYKFYSFLPYENEPSYCLVVQLERIKILIGSFFTENSLINYLKQKTIKNDSSLFPFTQKEQNDIREIFKDLSIIITTHFNQLLALPYIVSSFKIQMDNIKLFTSEPIVQLARSYFSEFYNNFNSLLLIHQKEPSLITDKEIDSLLSQYQLINFCQQVNSFTQSLDAFLMLELISNGYELGSSNVILHYFNKRICILTESSFFTYRYPKNFDFMSIRNIDIMITFPNILNESESLYEKEISNLMNEINSAGGKTDVTANRSYSNILMIVDPFFMFEFVDIFRYKISKDIKLVYLSKSIDSLMKYANINTGFINEKSIDKIYEFKLPFSFDEIETFSHFNSLNALIKSPSPVVKDIVNGLCPIAYFANKFSFFSGEANDLFEFFIRNLCPTIDEVILVNYPFKEQFDLLGKDKKLKVKSFTINYKLNREHYEKIISQVIPEKIYSMKKDMSDRVIKENESLYEIDKWSTESFNLEKEGIFYNKCYLLSQPKKSENLSYTFKKENLKFFLKYNKEEKENDKVKLDLIDGFENLLKKYFSMNNMEMTEFLHKKDSISISIVNNSYKSKTISEVQISLDNQEEPSIDIESENYEDTLYLNSLFSEIFE